MSFETIVREERGGEGEGGGVIVVANGYDDVRRRH